MCSLTKYYCLRSITLQYPVKLIYLHSAKIRIKFCLYVLAAPEMTEPQTYSTYELESSLPDPLIKKLVLYDLLSFPAVFQGDG